MSNLHEVYGDNYHNEAMEERVNHLIEMITNNLSHREFTYHLDNTDYIWNGNRLAPNCTKRLCQRVYEKNECLKLTPIDLSRPDHRALIPYFIENEPAEYFYLTDTQLNRFYLLFLTPSLMGAF